MTISFCFYATILSGGVSYCVLFTWRLRKPLDITHNTAFVTLTTSVTDYHRKLPYLCPTSSVPIAKTTASVCLLSDSSCVTGCEQTVMTFIHFHTWCKLQYPWWSTGSSRQSVLRHHLLSNVLNRFGLWQVFSISYSSSSAQTAIKILTMSDSERTDPSFSMYYYPTWWSRLRVELREKLTWWFQSLCTGEISGRQQPLCITWCQQHSIFWPVEFNSV